MVPERSIPQARPAVSLAHTIMRASRAGAVLIAAVLMLALTSVAPASAHQDSRPAPNGVSPWHYSEYWAITGSWYGEGYHRDYINGVHYNEQNALDFAWPGNGCNKRLYPMYNSMTVTRTDAANGMIEMRKSIDGLSYRVRYWHLNSINTVPGATVSTSTLIGYSGAKGNAVGCHLHMTVHRLGGGRMVVLHCADVLRAPVSA